MRQEQGREKQHLSDLSFICWQHRTEWQLAYFNRQMICMLKSPFSIVIQEYEVSYAHNNVLSTNYGWKEWLKNITHSFLTVFWSWDLHVVAIFAGYWRQKVPFWANGKRSVGCEIGWATETHRDWQWKTETSSSFFLTLKRKQTTFTLLAFPSCVTVGTAVVKTTRMLKLPSG